MISNNRISAPSVESTIASKCTPCGVGKITFISPTRLSKTASVAITNEKVGLISLPESAAYGPMFFIISSAISANNYSS